MTSLVRKNHDNYMLLATAPLIFCGTVLYGPRVLLLCGIAVLVAKAADVLASMMRREGYDKTDHSSELSALIFCLMLPANIPIYILVASVLLAVMIGKHAFGGKDVYPFNLAALAMCFASVNWADKVFVAVTPFAKIDLLSGYTTGATGTTAGIVKSGGVPAHGTLDLLLGNHPGSMGADFVLVILATGLFLILTKKISWQIPVSFLATCAVIAFAFPRLYGFPRVDSLQLELLNGIVLFTALFMLNDPTTTPKSPKAKILYGVLAGVLGMTFRYIGAFELGSCFALLLVNTMDGAIDRLVNGEFLGGIKCAAPKAEQTKENATEKPEKVAYKAEKPLSKEEKAGLKAERKAEKAVYKNTAADTFDLIGEAEDNLDEVIYSTRTLSIDEILKAEEQLKKQRKAGKK